jgi:hypothetical protein
LILKSSVRGWVSPVPLAKFLSGALDVGSRHSCSHAEAQALSWPFSKVPFSLVLEILVLGILDQF